MFNERNDTGNKDRFTGIEKKKRIVNSPKFIALSKTTVLFSFRPR